jgi:hypothetical protein
MMMTRDGTWSCVSLSLPCKLPSLLFRLLVERVSLCLTWCEGFFNFDTEIERDSHLDRCGDIQRERQKEKKLRRSRDRKRKLCKYFHTGDCVSSSSWVSSPCISLWSTSDRYACSSHHIHFDGDNTCARWSKLEIKRRKLRRARKSWIESKKVAQVFSARFTPMIVRRHPATGPAPAHVLAPA